MILGLKGKIKSMYDELGRIRAGTLVPTNELAPLSGMPDVTLVQYLGTKFKDGCTNKDGTFDINHLYSELGINPNLMTVEALIDLDQDSKWLVPEIFRDAIRKGLRTSPFYNRLVAASENVRQPQVNMPYVDLSDAEPQETAEGETISKGSITYGNKTVEIKKQAIGIDITYEAIQYTTLNLLTIFLQDVGIKLGQKLNNALINIAINGDQADLSQNAAVIGVDNPVLGLLYKDLLHAWIRGSRLGRTYSNIIAGEAMAEDILELDEFKQKQAGVPQKNIVVNETLPSQSQLFVSAQVPAHQAILVDPNFAFVQLTAAALLVEGEKIVSKQIQGTYASITTGFANIFRDARVIIDETLDIAGNDFPAFMTPTL